MSGIVKENRPDYLLHANVNKKPVDEVDRLVNLGTFASRSHGIRTILNNWYNTKTPPPLNHQH